MSEAQRTNALTALLCLERSLEDVLLALNRISWESDTELVVLQSSHARSVLNRFLGGSLTAREVENWSNAIEMREDIGIAPGHDDLKQIICELANPEVFAAITPDLARQLLSRLDNIRES